LITKNFKQEIEAEVQEINNELIQEETNLEELEETYVGSFPYFITEFEDLTLLTKKYQYLEA